jgi:hypothetical protein
MISGMTPETEGALPGGNAAVLRVIAGLEAEGLVTDVRSQAPHPGSLDITFMIGAESILVMVADGVPDVRIVGKRREYERPASELGGVLRDWANFREGWHS